MMSSSRKRPQLGKEGIYDVFALPCDDPPTVSVNFPVTNQTVRGVVNDGEENGFSYLRSGRAFKTPQALEGKRNSRKKKPEESWKPPGITTANLNLHSSHQSSFGFTVQPREAHPTCHSCPLDNFQNCSSSTAAQFDNFDFSAPIGGINKTEDNSVGAVLALEVKQKSYDKKTDASRKPLAMATSDLNRHSRCQSSLGIPVHPYEAHLTNHSYLGNFNLSTVAHPYDFSALVDGIKQNEGCSMGATQALAQNQSSLNKEMTEESRKPLVMTTSNFNCPSRCQLAPGIFMPPSEAHPTRYSLPVNNFTNFSLSTASQFGPDDFSAPVDGIKQSDIISMSAAQALEGNQNSHNKEKTEDYRKPQAMATLNLNPHKRCQSSLGIAMHPCEAHPTNRYLTIDDYLRNFRSDGLAQFDPYDFSAPSGGIKQNKYSSMGATREQNQNFLNKEKTEESRKPPVMTTFNLNLPPRSESSPGINMHLCEVRPGTAALNPCDFSAPIDGIKQTGDILVGGTETMDLPYGRRSILHPPAETSTTMAAPFKIDLNEPSTLLDADLN